MSFYENYIVYKLFVCVLIFRYFVIESNNYCLIFVLILSDFFVGGLVCVEILLKIVCNFVF